MSCANFITIALCFCINSCSLIKSQNIKRMKTKKMKTISNNNLSQKLDIVQHAQTPKEPLFFNQEEIIFENKDANIILAGTLTLPETCKQSPAVILISGMGPNDRDYTMLDHKLFLVLANYLTKQGIAVLRFDKRGVNKSTGTYSLELTSEDFASDVLAGIKYLKTRPEINSKQIGLIGHSEGGLIAPMLAYKSQDVAFIVMLAGVASTSPENILKQANMQLSANGATEKTIELDSKIRKQLLEIVINQPDLSVAQANLYDAINKWWDKLTPCEQSDLESIVFSINKTKATGFINMFNSPWYRYLIAYKPAEILKNINIPVLAINGDHDFVTISNIMLPIINQALKEANNNNYAIFELANKNHWLQTCKTGAIQEYATIKETISSEALEIIANWITKQVSKQ